MNKVVIDIIEDFLNYNREKYLSGIEIDSISQLLKAYREQQKQIKDLKDENDFLRFMYKGTEEYKSIERYASGDHIPRID